MNVLILVLEETFRASPRDVAVIQGLTARFRCTPPVGIPEPKVTWIKDGVPIRVESQYR